MKSVLPWALIVAGMAQMSCASAPSRHETDTCLATQVREFESLLRSWSGRSDLSDYAITIRQSDGIIAFTALPNPDSGGVGGGGSATYDCTSGALIRQEGYR